MLQNVTETFKDWARPSLHELVWQEYQGYFKFLSHWRRLSKVKWVSSAWVVVATELISKFKAVSPVTVPTGMAVPPSAFSVGFNFLWCWHCPLITNSTIKLMLAGSLSVSLSKVKSYICLFVCASTGSIGVRVSLKVSVTFWSIAQVVWLIVLPCWLNSVEGFLSLRLYFLS